MPNLCIGTRDLAHSLFRPQLARDFTDARDLTERLHALYKVATAERINTKNLLQDGRAPQAARTQTPRSLTLLA